MDWWITFDQQAADYLPDLRIEKEEPMDRHTSFRIGGPARRMAFPERGEQLVLLLDMAARCGATEMRTAADYLRISPAGRGWRAWNSPTASRARWAARCA